MIFMKMNLFIVDTKINKIFILYISYAEWIQVMYLKYPVWKGFFFLSQQGKIFSHPDM